MLKLVQVPQPQPPELDHCLRVFRLFLRLHYYSDEHGTFVAAPAMPWTIPDKICDALEALRSIDQGTAKQFSCSPGIDPYFPNNLGRLRYYGRAL